MPGGTTIRWSSVGPRPSPCRGGGIGGVGFAGQQVHLPQTRLNLSVSDGDHRPRLTSVAGAHHRVAGIREHRADVDVLLLDHHGVGDRHPRLGGRSEELLWVLDPDVGEVPPLLHPRPADTRQAGGFGLIKDPHHVLLQHPVGHLDLNHPDVPLQRGTANQVLQEPHRAVVPGGEREHHPPPRGLIVPPVAPVTVREPAPHLPLHPQRAVGVLDLDRRGTRRLAHHPRHKTRQCRRGDRRGGLGGGVPGVRPGVAGGGQHRHHDDQSDPAHLSPPGHPERYPASRFP